MSEAGWRDVDAWIGEKLVGDDPALLEILRRNAAAGLPAIDVSPAQGKLLHLLVRLSKACRVLEIGTLGGYSTTWLARAVPADGKVVTLEIDPHCAEVARANLAQAGVAERVDLLVGPALASLERLTASGVEPFDFVFIDADKENNANYLRLALQLSRPGTVIVCDNVVREGRVLNAGSGEPAIEGTRAFFEELASNPRLDATAVQTVGLKGWDGFALALVEQGGLEPR